MYVDLQPCSEELERVALVLGVRNENKAWPRSLLIPPKCLIL